jgi:hypothetical protein
MWYIILFNISRYKNLEVINSRPNGDFSPIYNGLLAFSRNELQSRGYSLIGKTATLQVVISGSIPDVSTLY